MKKLFILGILVFFSTNVFATHYLGGELSWTCESTGPNAGKFKFFVSLYRECGTGASNSLPDPIVLTTNAPGGSISCAQVGSSVDISPNCWDPTQEINCNGIAPGSGAVEMRKYESGYVQIIGNPPPTGWSFTFTGCCRPAHVNLMGGINNSYTLRAFMYPYTPTGSTSPLNTSTCFDNAPKFLEPPITVVASGGLVVNNLLGYDKDYDSLTYSWSYPMGSNISSPVAFATGYAFNSPFPSLNSVSLNPSTGQLVFNPNIMGSFASCVQIDSYRYGQMIASTFRDYPLIISAANTNNTPPIISLSKIDPSQVTSIPQYGLPDSSYYYFNVSAGDSVRFKITAVDANLLPNFLPQSLTWQGTSAQFGATSSAGCDHPPCATSLPYGSQTSFTNTLSNEIRFDWLTSCENYLIDGYNKPAVTYVFVLKFIDDACPVPASMTIPIIVNVFPPNIGTPDTIYTNVISSSNTQINWSAPIDTSSDFNGYEISFSPNIGGPYIPLDTLFQYSQTQYSVNQLQLGTGFIFVTTLGPCGLPSIPTTPVLIQNCSPTILIDLPSIDTASVTTKLLYVVTPNCISNYQWQLEAGSMQGWQNLQDDSTYAGSLMNVLIISGIDSTFNGFKYRCLVSGSGVSDTSNTLTLYVANNIDLDEFAKSLLTIISPNPNDGHFTIDVGEAFIGARYKIVDGMGRSIEGGEIQSPTKDFDLSDKSKGVYRITLISKEITKTMVVVLQ